MKYSHDIEDEEKGVKHYRTLAKKDGHKRPKFLSMAKDEAKHKRMLEALENKKK